MKGLKKGLYLFLTVSLMTVSFYTGAGAQADSIDNGTNLADLVLIRPLGVIAGILGTGLFVVTLPFTIPTKSVDDASKMLIIEPFRFSFAREFSDKNL